jgi:hypothetical protein
MLLQFAINIEPDKRTNGVILLPGMKLGDKIRYLREVEGSLRGMGRAINQQELVRLIEAETGGKLSQSYLVAD